jgi:hypothetical protein
MGDAVPTPGAPYTPVGQTLDMTTLQMRMYDYNQWIAVNDPGMTKYDYSEVVAGFQANYQAIVQNNAAVAPDQQQVSLVAGIGLAVMLAPAALAGLDLLGVGAVGSTTAEGDGVSGTALARQLGAEGEQAVGITGPKVGIRIPGSNQLRFPDALTNTTLTEVKNVASQGLTQQLRDYLAFSESEGLDLDLYVRGSLSPKGPTYLTQPLADAVQAGRINLKFIPGTF